MKFSPETLIRWLLVACAASPLFCACAAHRPLVRDAERPTPSKTISTVK